MAKLSVTFETAAGSITVDSPTLSDANMDRLIAWATYQFPQVDENGDPLPITNAVRAAALRELGESIWRGTKNNVLRHEEAEAVQAARAAVEGLE
jgi:hypothetical protein